jgi:hypothetical protein
MKESINKLASRMRLMYNVEDLTTWEFAAFKTLMRSYAKENNFEYDEATELLGKTLPTKQELQERVIQYLASLTPSQIEILTKSVSRERTMKARRSYEQNHQSYLNKIQKDKNRGETMKDLVKPGMIVKCNGTNDRVGLREVLEVNEFGIIARKIVKRIKWDLKKEDPNRIYYERDSYITNHRWDKVASIVEDFKLAQQHAQ